MREGSGSMPAAVGIHTRSTSIANSSNGALRRLAALRAKSGTGGNASEESPSTSASNSAASSPLKAVSVTPPNNHSRSPSSSKASEEPSLPPPPHSESVEGKESVIENGKEKGNDAASKTNVAHSEQIEYENKESKNDKENEKDKIKEEAKAEVEEKKKREVFETRLAQSKAKFERTQKLRFATRLKCASCLIPLLPGEPSVTFEEKAGEGLAVHARCFQCNHCSKSLEGLEFVFFEGFLFDLPHWEQVNTSIAKHDKVIEVFRKKLVKVRERFAFFLPWLSARLASTSIPMMLLLHDLHFI